MTFKTFTKDPDAVLDYKFDWAAETNGSGGSDWLAEDETISSYVVTAAGGITKDSDSRTDENTSVTVWLSAGKDGISYNVACKIVTSASRTDERTVTIKVQTR
jgi:hypothetical protein